MLRFSRVLSLAIASFVFAATTALAGYPAPEQDIYLEDDDVAGLEIVVDLVIARPLGLAATVLGTAFFVAGAPFAALAGDFETPAHFLVVEPFRYTFERPLGVGLN